MSRSDCLFQHARNAWRRKRLGQCVLLYLSFFIVPSLVNSRKPSSRAFRNAISKCEKFTQPLQLDADRKYFPETLSRMLLEIDHVFVLSVDSCKTKLPQAFSGRATCVVGRKLDVCAPRAYIRGPYTHAMKVSFMHAAVLHLAQKSRYEHIAVLEEDVIIRNDALSADLVREFRALLKSNASRAAGLVINRNAASKFEPSSSAFSLFSNPLTVSSTTSRSLRRRFNRASPISGGGNKSGTLKCFLEGSAFNTKGS